MTTASPGSSRADKAEQDEASDSVPAELLERVPSWEPNDLSTSPPEAEADGEADATKSLSDQEEVGEAPGNEDRSAWSSRGSAQRSSGGGPPPPTPSSPPHLLADGDPLPRGDGASPQRSTVLVPTSTPVEASSVAPQNLRFALPEPREKSHAWQDDADLDEIEKARSGIAAALLSKKGHYNQSFKSFKELKALRDASRNSRGGGDAAPTPNLPGMQSVPTVFINSVALPDLKRPNSGKLRRHRAARTSQLGPPRGEFKLRPLSAEPDPRPLDGFFMIEACDVDLPERAEEIRLENKGINGINAEDLAFFESLKSLNLDNNLLEDVSPCGVLPCLQRLSASCNRITCMPSLADGMFFQLQVLDLSFNHLRARDVFGRDASWSRMPSLRELDVSGNHFKRLPDALGSWPSLTKLSLEYNRLNSDCLKPLSALPKLEYLALAHNNISDLPGRIGGDFSTFQKLRVLDISANKIRSPDALQALQGLKPGVEVYIGDNPIAHKMRHSLVQPVAVPHSRPGSVQSNAGLYESISVSVRSSKAPHPDASHRGPLSEPALNSSRREQRKGAHSQSLATGDKGVGVRDSVVLKVQKNTPDRPSLAKSLTHGLNLVQEKHKCEQDGMVKFEGLSHEKLVEVFDNLQTQLDNWKLLDTVAEEVDETREASSHAAARGEAPSHARPPVPGRCDDRHASRAQAARTASVLHNAAMVAASVGDVVELDDFADPTEQVAYLLGLDPLLLAHHTGLCGSDAAGAMARLKFAIAHPATLPAQYGPDQMHHLQMTQSAVLKQRSRKLEPMISLPPPPSPHTQQMASIQTLLDGMKSRLLAVQQTVTKQLTDFERLVQSGRDVSSASTMERDETQYDDDDEGEQESPRSPRAQSMKRSAHSRGQSEHGVETQTSAGAEQAAVTGLERGESVTTEESELASAGRRGTTPLHLRHHNPERRENVVLQSAAQSSTLGY